MDSPQEPITYEQALSFLHGLLGQRVMVSTTLTMEGRSRLLSTLNGTLRRGRDTDLAQEFHDEGMPRFPPGEAMVFEIGADGSCFVFHKADFKLGIREGGLLPASRLYSNRRASGQARGRPGPALGE
jgi:hypothetical protein